MVGEISRSSGIEPAVTASQTSSSTAMGTSPRAQNTQAGSGSRICSQAPPPLRRRSAARRSGVVGRCAHWASGG